jgi:hypothetical protein
MNYASSSAFKSSKFEFSGLGVVFTKCAYALNALMAFGILLAVAASGYASTFPLLGAIAIFAYGIVFVVGFTRTSLTWLPIVVFEGGFHRIILRRSVRRILWSNISEIRFVKFYFKTTETTRWKVILVSTKGNTEISDYLCKFDQFVSLLNLYAAEHSIPIHYCDKIANSGPIQITRMDRELPTGAP